MPFHSDSGVTYKYKYLSVIYIGIVYLSILLYVLRSPRAASINVDPFRHPPAIWMDKTSAFTFDASALFSILLGMTS